MSGSLPEPIESARVTDARARAAGRRQRQRARLRPLAIAVGVAVAVAVLESELAPGTSGRRLATTLVLAAYLALLAALVRGIGIGRPGTSAALVAALGATGVALAGLQPHGPTEVAASAAVWTAVARLRPAMGIALAVATTVALDVTLALTSSPWRLSVVASTLLCAVLGLSAWFMRQAAENQDRTELLLAELEDARESQLEAAAVAERGRIARELHDILAHSLSGLVIQIEGTRLLAERQDASSALRDGLGRAAELARAGLAEAKHAVGILREGSLPSAEDIPLLVESFRRDFGLDVELRTAGAPWVLPPETGLVLYRAAQEALTNATRHAPGARAEVELRYEPRRVQLQVTNGEPAGDPPQARQELGRAGGGRGLAGLRDRVAGVGGTVDARPVARGFLVAVSIPLDPP
ncbi:MAG: sensor histidine kinase [Gaiellaceae bacterium]